MVFTHKTSKSSNDDERWRRGVMCVGELMNSARHSMWRSHRGAPSLGFLCARGKTGTYCIFVACCESPKKKKKKKDIARISVFLFVVRGPRIITYLYWLVLCCNFFPSFRVTEKNGTGKRKSGFNDPRSGSVVYRVGEFH